MSISPRTRTADEQGSKPAKRYRVVRGDLPANLVDVVSAAHAAAIAYSSAGVRALEGHAQSPSEPDKTRHGDSTSRSREVHHE